MSRTTPDAGRPLRTRRWMNVVCGLIAAGSLVACLHSGDDDAGTTPGGSTSPQINAQPAATTVDDGAAATFSVSASASGSGTLSYQWLRGGAAIAAATAATLTLPSVSLADSGAQFSVRVSDGAASVTSNAVTLTVRAVAPRVTSAPVAATVTAGQPASFNVTAAGSAPLSYQWQRNGIDIVGATASSYTLASTALGDSGATFAVRVSNSAGQLTSATAALVVNAAPPTLTVGATRLVFGTSHVVAMRADGSVLAWGGNGSGQLGSGAAIAGTNARQVTTGAVAVAAGATESLALGADGVLRGWGRKFANVTIVGGDAATTGTDAPTPAPGGWPAGMTQVVTGTANPFGVALRNDGTVWHMPGNATAITGGSNQTARQVAGLPIIATLGPGLQGDATAIAANGSVWRIAFVSSGNGNWLASGSQVTGLAGVASTACNGVSCIALDAAGAVQSFPGLGNVAPTAVAGLPLVRQIAVTGTGFLAVGRDGTLWRWNQGATPQAVPGLSTVQEAAGGLQSVLVRLADGSVWGYGPNTFGELGSGVAATTTPVQVPGIDLN